VELNWPSAKGGQKKYAHLVCTWIRTSRPTLLLITCHNPDEPLASIRYWGSTNLNLDAQLLVDILPIPWEVETFFEYEKDLLGSDHYQVMTAKAILRIWTLTACMVYFLEKQRSEMDKPRATCGDARCGIQKDHLKNMLYWLQARFREGVTIDQLLVQLA
jgi:hypothetical protein